jgi:hypothetical protein
LFRRSSFSSISDETQIFSISIIPEWKSIENLNQKTWTIIWAARSNQHFIINAFFICNGLLRAPGMLELNWRGPLVLPAHIKWGRVAMSEEEVISLTSEWLISSKLFSSRLV